MIRRSFAFNQAAQQGDTGFRLGYQLALESFPLVTQPNGWYRTIGIGAVYEKEYGDATHDAAGGMFNGYPFNQSRWGFDVRFAIPAGEWVVIMPALGYGRIGADLQRMNPTTPDELHGRERDGAVLRRRQRVVPVGRSAHPRRA